MQPFTLIAAWAEDYFIIAHNDYPWEAVPPLVIGRRGYDNYLVGYAGEKNVSVIGRLSKGKGKSDFK